MHSTIRLHPIRLEQLRSIAATVSTSASAVVEQFLSCLMQKGEIPDRFDEFSADLDGEFIKITLGGYQLPLVDVLLASKLSGDILGLMTNPTARVARRELPDGMAFVVKRAGQGFRLSVYEGQTVRSTITVSFWILIDMQRQLMSRYFELFKLLTGEDLALLGEDETE